MKNNYFDYISLIFLVSTSIFLIGLQMKAIGWILFIIGLITLFFSEKIFRKDIFLIYLSLALLAVTEISTDTSYAHMLSMGIKIGLAVLLPYLLSRFIFKDYSIKFGQNAKNWQTFQIAYLIFVIVLTYFLIPFYLKSTGAYLNWSVNPGFENIVKLFIGTNALGIWDELFFVMTCLAILRKHFDFSLANISQAVIFTSFLYELGFIGWGVIMIFLFALTQGYIFRKTESLAYIITIHLSIDFILFLALINSHHPSWMPIFLS